MSGRFAKHNGMILCTPYAAGALIYNSVATLRHRALVIDAVRPSATAAGAAPHAPHHGPGATHAAFRHALLHAVQGHVAAKRAQPSAVPVHRAVMRVPGPPKALPQELLDALSQAMTQEGVAADWQPALEFIMARELDGRVGAHSPIHSARGLYQLTAANYHYNPRGAASFGHAVEEAQGGIRYIRARYVPPRRPWPSGASITGTEPQPTTHRFGVGILYRSVSPGAAARAIILNCLVVSLWHIACSRSRDDFLSSRTRIRRGCDLLWLTKRKRCDGSYGLLPR